MQPADHFWNADLYQQKHAFVFQFGTDLLHVLNPQPGERILDLGCGTGELTARIAESGADVVGLDASESMIASARQSFPHLSFQLGDARTFVTQQPFDAVFSNATLHWIAETDQPAVLTHLFHVLKPGGRFVGELGGQGNVARILECPEPGADWVGHYQQGNLNYFPSPGQYTQLLEAAGFSVRMVQFFDRDTPLADPQTGIADWLTMFRGEVLQALSDSDRQTILLSVNEALRRTNFRDGTWYADYKRLRFMATKPSIAA